MDLYELRPGDKVRTAENNIAEIVAPTVDGEWIRVRYTASEDAPELIETEDLCSEDEIVELIRRKRAGGQPPGSGN